MSTKESQHSGVDIEKAHPIQDDPMYDIPQITVQGVENLDDGVPRNKGVFAPLWKLARRFDAFGAETRGIERVLPEQRPVVSNMLFTVVLPPVDTDEGELTIITIVSPSEHSSTLSAISSDMILLQMLLVHCMFGYGSRRKRLLTASRCGWQPT